MAALSELMAGIPVLTSHLTEDLWTQEIPMIRTNSLEVEKGDVFLCIRGEVFDGHDFISTAAARGASLIVCERVTDYLAGHSEIPYLQTGNTRQAAARMWHTFCGCPGERMILVAVTGTNGKTSITYFLREIFKRAGYQTGVLGTVRCMVGDEIDILTDTPGSKVNAMTTPPPHLLYTELRRMADAGVEIVFMEASSHALDQYRLDPLRFSLGIFTNLTPEHLDYHRTMEAYYATKKRLFESCETALINADDEYGARLIGELKAEGKDPAAFSVRTVCDYSAKNLYDRGFDGVGYHMLEEGLLHHIRCPIAGPFTVSNTLAAAGAARLFGIKPEIIRDALNTCPPIPGRMERLVLPAGSELEVFIDYAHTPDALENALRTLGTLKKRHQRLVVLFGCGGDRDRTKRPVMGRIATELADYAVITGDNCRSENPRSILYDIIRGIRAGASYKVIERREEAIRTVIRTHRPGDIILLAGKGHEDYEIDADGKHPFSEREIVLEALAESGRS